MDINEIASDESLVLVYDAPDQGMAELVCATLQAAGIRAVVQNQYAGPASGLLPYLGLSDSRGVLVPVVEAETARAILAEQAPTEEELTQIEETDPMTLEEAEAQVK